jgi:hypothetical protein
MKTEHAMVEAMAANSVKRMVGSLAYVMVAMLAEMMGS